MSDPKQPLVFAAITAALSLGLGIVATPGAEVSPPTASPVVGDGTASLGEPFVLAAGETAVSDDGLRVTFQSVIEDSRCPADVQCVWEGNAVIVIAVAVAGERPTPLSLNTNTGFATQATYASHAIELIELEPYPRVGSRTDEPYRATLVVRLTGAGPSLTPTASPPPTPSRGPSDS